MTFQETNYRLTKIILDATLEINRIAPKNRDREMSDLIKRSTRHDNKNLMGQEMRKVKTLRKQKLKTRSLGTRRHQLFALNNAKGNVSTNMDELVKIYNV